MLPPFGLELAGAHYEFPQGNPLALWLWEVRTLLRTWWLWGEITLYATQLSTSFLAYSSCWVTHPLAPRPPAPSHAETLLKGRQHFTLTAFLTGADSSGQTVLPACLQLIIIHNTLPFITHERQLSVLISQISLKIHLVAMPEVSQIRPIPGSQLGEVSPQFCLGYSWQHLETIWVSLWEGGVTAGIENRSATKTRSAQNVNSADVKKPWIRPFF